MRLSVATPTPAAWRRFLSVGLLGLGSLLVLSGVIYFFAYNWAELHRFAKLGLILGATTGACVAAWRLEDGLAGRFALLFAAVLVGPLLAVYGQAYQTGADPYGLFLGWSALILPWVVLARFQPLWLLLLALVNTGLLLYQEQVLERGDLWIVLVLGLVNGGAWLAHEVLAWRGVDWLQGRWMPRVLATVTVLPLLGLAALLIVEAREAGVPGAVALVLTLLILAATYGFHRKVRPELFLLTLDALSAMTLVTTLCARVLLFHEQSFEEGSFLLLGLLLIGELGAAAWWLRAEARGPEEA